MFNPEEIAYEFSSKEVSVEKGKLKIVVRVPVPQGYPVKYKARDGSVQTEHLDFIPPVSVTLSPPSRDDIMHGAHEKDLVAQIDCMHQSFKQVCGNSAVFSTPRNAAHSYKNPCVFQQTGLALAVFRAFTKTPNATLVERVEEILKTGPAMTGPSGPRDFQDGMDLTWKTPGGPVNWILQPPPPPRQKGGRGLFYKFGIVVPKNHCIMEDLPYHMQISDVGYVSRSCHHRGRSGWRSVLWQALATTCA